MKAPLHTGFSGRVPVPPEKRFLIKKMKILVVNGTYRRRRTTTELAERFMEGARTQGAEADMEMLLDHDIALCTNCLRCYHFEGEGVAPCSVKDDMDGLIERLVEADGILFASPVHNGFVTGLMTLFWERLSWRVAAPGGPALGMMSIESRLQTKVRAMGSIASSGGMPRVLRRFCDEGTKWLKSNAGLLLHGQWIGDLYAHAELQRMPESAGDWRRLYDLRRLSDRQLQQAHDLGVRMARAIAAGRLRATTMKSMVPAGLGWFVNRWAERRPLYRTSGGGREE